MHELEEKSPAITSQYVPAGRLVWTVLVSADPDRLKAALPLPNAIDPLRPAPVKG